MQTGWRSPMGTHAWVMGGEISHRRSRFLREYKGRELALSSDPSLLP
ncbi:hypothetical protein [Phormidium sp. CCY1219]|nr:hypothetical protein [Phormidium sp. CCY1219]